MRRHVGQRAAAALAALAIVANTCVAMLATATTARGAGFTCYAGQDGAAGTLSGVYNTYYIPPNGTLAAGTTSFNIGTIDTAGGGASTAVAVGNELLIIQMQSGTLNSVNSSSYGMTSVGQAGLYEYVQVQGVSGSTVTVFGAGSGGGLINSYTEAAGPGQQTYQIVRVPQWTSATLSSNYRAAYWDGKTGGVSSLDISTTLNLGGASVYATGNGFRGGGYSVATTTPTAILNNDWVDSALMNGTPTSPTANSPGQGFKGEGILGTPAFTFQYTNFTTPGSPVGPAVNVATADGYSGGDMAMGAPGDGGGGGTDADPAANDQNTGGGGGSNGGAGGNGGYPWGPNEANPQSNSQYPKNNPGQHSAGNYAVAGANNNPDIGGRGATTMSSYIAATRIFMGGGGGAGTNNNNSDNNTYNQYGSSGGVGGGIVLMRIANTSGTAATVYADGTTGLAPDNDGGGGGGAGGTIVVTSPNTFTGITAYARGAAGTSAFYKTSDTSYTTAHGPGGGGGGGAILSSSAVSATVTGGANGVTVYGTALAYGSTSGTTGVSQTITASQIPGVPSGAECSSSSSGLGYIGPVDTGEATYGGANETGSYDGVSPATNNNDFTARSFVPSGANFINSGTTPGSPVGNTLTGTTTVNVPNIIYYANNPSAVTLKITATAPTTLAGWTARICPDNNGVTQTPSTPNCASTNPFPASTAGATTSLTYALGANSGAVSTVVWLVYTVPANTVAFTRYDAVIGFGDGTTINYTHNELYAGFIPITKTATVTTTNCPAGVSPSITSGVCSGGKIQYSFDYRNIMAGAGQGTEGSLLAAFLATAPGQLSLTDDGSQSTTSQITTPNWATFGTMQAAPSDTTTGTTYTYYTGIPASGAGSATWAATDTKWIATIGGTTFQLTPSGYGGTAQGTITFTITVK